MRQLIVAGGYPYSTHTFVIRQISASLAAGHDVYVLASNHGDKAGESTALKLGMPNQDHLIYGDYSKSKLFSPSLCRFSSRVRTVADAAWYGKIMAERRKTFFCEVMSRLPKLDLIHANFAGWAFEVALPLSQILQIPLTVTVHNNHEQLRRRELETLKQLQRHAKALALVSESSKRIWTERTSSDARLRVIYNGIDLSEFANSEPSKPGSSINILTIGRLAKEKRFDEGIRIFKKLKNQFSDCHYHIIGDGPERANLEALAKKLELGESITFYGTLSHEQVREKLFDSDILLHCGIDESFGLVITEAMAAYKPVVATNSGAIPELICDKASGYLYDPGNEEQALGYLIQLTNNAEQRLAMGVNGREVVERKFSWQSHMQQMEKLWRDALEN